MGLRGFLRARGCTLRLRPIGGIALPGDGTVIIGSFGLGGLGTRPYILQGSGSGARVGLETHPYAVRGVGFGVGIVCGLGWWGRVCVWRSRLSPG